jgi:glutathione reductase (NADPH)
MTGPDALAVGDDLLRARHIVLATGAVPRSLDIPGAGHIRGSEDFLNLSRLPERIIFIGGGYISFEFAHVAIRCGAQEVIIFNRSDQPLKRFDPDMVAILLEAGGAGGVWVRLEETATAITSGETGLTVTTTTGGRYETDLVVGAIGRVPNLSVLEGGSGEVESDARGVRVTPYLQSISNPRVYAVGDCAATGYMLAPVADAEGKAVARNIAEGNVETIDYAVVPSVVFTIPSIASVGLGEADATEQGRDFRINQGSTAKWPSSRRIGETHGGYKVLIDNQTDQIVGAHIVRHQAADAINILALAMKYGITASQLEAFMWAYPTLTSDLKYMVR